MPPPEESVQPLFLVYVRDATAIPDDFDPHGDAHRVAQGVYLVRSPLSRSKLYHRIKWQLSAGAGLLVAPLADDPKFKGMDEGALAWLRAGAHTPPA
ncbi:hypothetical protein ACKTEK_00220 [Tepidamorphus sp. 3E244]|uniref:hypothetical protein n=1 Tax=Tepidamorphus sp. 3E244 TaxID=3385498 RepID=UPI0038FC5C61